MATARVGENLRLIRTSRGLSQRYVGKLVQRSQGIISGLERGLSPPLTLLNELARALDIPVRLLVEPITVSGDGTITLVRDLPSPRRLPAPATASTSDSSPLVDRRPPAPADEVDA